MNEKEEEYKNALVKILHHVEACRVWEGTEWRCHGIPEYRQLKIKKIVELALFSEKSKDSPICEVDKPCYLRAITGRCTLRPELTCPHQKIEYNGADKC